MRSGRGKIFFFNEHFGGPTNLGASGKCPNCPCGNEALCVPCEQCTLPPQFSHPNSITEFSCLEHSICPYIIVFAITCSIIKAKKDILWKFFNVLIFKKTFAWWKYIHNRKDFYPQKIIVKKKKNSYAKQHRILSRANT